MKKFSLLVSVLVLIGVSIVVFGEMPTSPKAVAVPQAVPQVGRYQLRTDAGTLVVYRLDTVNGEIIRYSERLGVRVVTVGSPRFVNENGEDK